MSDQELHDLLHERVADVTMPDVSERAWGRARRIRRRRTTLAVAGAVAAVVVSAVVVDHGAGLDRSQRPVLPAGRPDTPGPAPTTGAGESGARSARPDGRYDGWRVYWGPSPDGEEALPRTDSPFPDTVDLSAPAPDLADRPISSALAAYAVGDDSGGLRLLLLARDGTLRSVDTSRVGTLDDGAGHDVSVARDTLLSPTGEYLAFPQAGSVLVLTLATGGWRRIDTGDRVTTTVEWAETSDLWLPRTSQGGWGPIYSVVDGTRVGSRNLQAPGGPFADSGGPYGRWRLGVGGIAQAWGRVEGLPGPAGEATPSQAVLVEGATAASDALLVLREGPTSGATARPDFCCGVAFWLRPGVIAYGSRAQPHRVLAWRVGTHDVRRVTSIEGYDPDRQFVDSSYADVWR